MEELIKEYEKRKPNFDKAVNSSILRVQTILKEHQMGFVSVDGRVKSLESFLIKCKRKKYRKPFTDNEDFCGLRIVVFYPEEIEKVQVLISKEFDVKKTFDKPIKQNVNEFGYRSRHNIVKIAREKLLQVEFSGLRHIKIEIQIRTILMHAWAEVEHKLSYKAKNYVPTELSRELFILSAKFEDLDMQFQRMKENSDNYQAKIAIEIINQSTKSEYTELNIDSLTALLNVYLSDFPKSPTRAVRVLKDLIDLHLTFDIISDLLKKIKPWAIDINKEVFPDGRLRLTQPTLLGYAIDIFTDNKVEGVISTTKRAEIVDKFRNIVRP